MRTSLGLGLGITMQGKVGAAGAFDPLSLPNIVGWLDASDSAFYTDVGGNASAWSDKNESLPDVVQATASQRPIINVGYFKYSAANVSRLVSASTFFDAVDKHILFLARIDVTGAERLLMGVNGVNAQYGANTTDFRVVGSPSIWGNALSVSSTVDVGLWKIYEFVLLSSGTSKLIYDGVVIDSTTNAQASSSSTLINVIGGGRGSWDGDIAQVVINNGELTGSDLTATRDFLTGKIPA